MLLGVLLALLNPPVIGGVVPREGAVIPPQAEASFVRGAEEAGAMGRRRPIAISADRERRIAQAKDALRRGEQAWLEVELGRAVQALSEAERAFMEAPNELPDAGPAVRASVRLAQVHLTQRKRRAADEVIRRALMSYPGFPGDSQPPPDLAKRIERVRRRIQLDTRLRVESEVARAEVRINGVLLGTAPLTIKSLPKALVRVQVGKVVRMVDLTEGDADLRVADDDAAFAELRRSVLAEDSRRGFAAAARLEEGHGAEQTCLTVVDETDTVIARLEGGARRALGGHLASTPEAPEEWLRLGSFCAADAPANMSPAEVVASLWGGPATSSGSSSVKTPLGWTSIGLGAATWGLAGFFAASAFQASDDFRDSGASADEDLARRDALIADVSIGVGAALVGTGLYLVLTDD